jgi:hypothetical protein
MRMINCRSIYSVLLINSNSLRTELNLASPTQRFSKKLATNFFSAPKYRI